MSRFKVGTGQRTPCTTHSKLAKAAARVNWLVNLGYQQILVTDQETGFKCIANDVVTAEQLQRYLRAEEFSIARILRNNGIYNKSKGQK